MEHLKKKSHEDLMIDYHTSGRMLLNMAMAVGRLVIAGSSLTRLAGFTERIMKLNRVLDDLNQGRYERSMVEREGPPLVPDSGTVEIQNNIIKFEDVPIITPNGELLLDHLNLEVRSGMNVLVTGPNGCGKSSLFRVLSGLWPIFGGKLTKPSPGNIFYIPQRPYFSLGTLRDQLIYPHNKIQMEESNITDDDLMEYLREINLEYLVEREEKGLDAVQDWFDLLSGGEKQRINMARLFYHSPQFAILDECTSAISVEIEGYIYKKCKQSGITLFTVSHRKGILAKYHEYLLVINDVKSYSFEKITNSINLE